jgi:hypothetical protein
LRGFVRQNAKLINWWYTSHMPCSLASVYSAGISFLIPQYLLILYCSKDSEYFQKKVLELLLNILFNSSYDFLEYLSNISENSEILIPNQAWKIYLN